MVQFSRTFRVFVSSTFSDLVEERNALQRNVFPKLRQLCTDHGFRFQAIDLRWGVPEEATLDQQAMQICIKEIERCQHTELRPNFLILLGDRYGTRMAPSEVRASRFEEIRAAAPEEDRGFLDYWYQKDENAVPPVYLLKPRHDEFINYETWRSAENRLLSILRNAVRDTELSEAEHLDFFGSATEQEIYYGALNVPDANEHVLCLFRTIENVPNDRRAEGFIDLTEQGTRDTEATERLKSLKSTLLQHLSKEGAHSDPSRNIKRYKAAWVVENRTEYSGSITTDHLDKLCQDALSFLSATITNEIKRAAATDSAIHEQDEHWRFARERAAHFTGRETILASIMAYIEGGDRRPFVLWGEGGAGKTALLAEAAIRAAYQGHNNSESPPSEHVMARFIGATPTSSDGRSLLESLCRQLAHRYGKDEHDLSSDYNALVKAFQAALTYATAAQPLVIVLDALDQLSTADNARALQWLPATLPDHVRLVVSTLPGDTLTTLEQKRPAPYVEHLTSMPRDEGVSLLDTWLREVGRTLTKTQHDQVLDKFAANGNPLYLKLAFEQVQQWKSFTPLTPLSTDLPGIITDLFDRLESPQQHGQCLVSRSLGYLSAARYGLTEDELLDILSEDERVRRDFKERFKYHEPPERRLPVVVWSRLFFDLEPYLTERRADETSLIGFYHRALSEAAASRYLTGVTKERHTALAGYFGDRNTHPLFKDTARRMPDHRVASELPYQQTEGALWGQLGGTLTDLHFIEAKCAAGMTYDLVADYIRAREVLPGAQEEVQREREREEAGRRYGAELIAYAAAYSERRHSKRAQETPTTADEPTSGAFRIATRLRDRFARRPWGAHHNQQELSVPLLPSVPLPPSPVASDRQDEDSGVEGDLVSSLHVRVSIFHHFVDSHSHLFTKFADIDSFCIQSAYNYADAGPVAEQAQRIIITERSTTPFLLRISRSPFCGRLSCMRTLEGHASDIDAVSITSDGRRVVSGSYDKTIRVWDVETGKCEQVLEGHTGPVAAVSITPDGRRAITTSHDGTVRVWDVKDGECERVLQGHTDQVIAVSITADGRRAVSGSRDKTVRIWDVETGKCERVLDGDRYALTFAAVSITPDGRRAVSGTYRNTVWVLDCETGKDERVLAGHTGPVVAVSISPDGRRAVSGSHDKTIRVWDVETGECERVLEGHADEVIAVSITPDGRRAVSGSNDQTIRVWDVETGECERVLEGHTSSVHAISIAPDGRRAVSGGHDYSIRVWDLEGDGCERVLEGHTEPVLAVSITPDGKRALSGSLDDTIRIWNVETGKCERVLGGHTGWVDAVSITSDGRRAMSGSKDGTVRVWDLETGECERAMDWHASSIYSKGCLAVSITPDGRRAVSGDQDQTIRVWDVETGECERVLEGHTSYVNAVSITPDGRKSVSGSGIVGAPDYTVRVWDVETGECERVLEGHASSVEAVSITPDGRRVVSGSGDVGSEHADNTVRVWDLKTVKPERVLRGHTGLVCAVSITPDGRRAVSGSYDKTIRVWDLEKWSLKCMTSLDLSIRSLAFSNDCLVVGTDYGVALFYKSVNFFD